MNHDVRHVWKDDGTYRVTLIREVEIEVEVSHDPETGEVSVDEHSTVGWSPYCGSGLSNEERASVINAVACVYEEPEEEGAE